MCLRRVVSKTYFFFLPAFFAFFAFLAFLAMLPSVIPSNQCTPRIDVHEERVHHNHKIDSTGFEEGKRRSLPSRSDEGLLAKQ